MSTLLAADLHMTSNPREAARWDLFKWLGVEIARLNAKELVIAGDGTEAKDRHSGELVNHMVAVIEELLLCQALSIYWIRGNHDGLNPEEPFFKFLSVLPRFHFITKPTPVKLSIGPTILLPNTAKWEEDWADIDFTKYDFAVAHQTFSGAVSETGFRLVDGLPATALDGVRIKAYSGDIHVPQKFGKKGEYIGAPYRTRFGDTYEGRCLFVDRGARTGSGYVQKDLHFPMAGEKHVVVVNSLEQLEEYSKVPEGANVKIRIKVSRADLPLWQDTKAKAKAEAERLGWSVHDVELVRTEVGGTTEGAVAIRAKTTSHIKTFTDYAMAKAAPPEVVTAGKRILKQLGCR